jgi:beta-lactamase superfamily II metal-dependent hydrolase
MNTYRSMGIKVFRTDEQGSIVAASDGERITWNCAPSETWQQGEPTAAP